MSTTEQRFRLEERVGRKLVEVWGFPVQLAGDPDLCQRLRSYLKDPIPTLSRSLDPATGERGTRVVVLGAGAPGWLEGCLRRAAEELGLRLSEVPLGAG